MYSNVVLKLSCISCVIVLQEGRRPMDLAVANDLNFNECSLCKNVLNPAAKDTVTPGQCTLPKLSLCCVCALDLGYIGSMCDGCNQSWKHLKALENKVSAGAPGPLFSQEIISTRALVGRSLQYRLDLIVVNILLQTSDGVDMLCANVLPGLMRQTLQAECKRGARSNTKQIVSENCDVDLSVSDLEREAARREKKEGLPVKFSRSVIPACLRMRSVAKAAGLVALVPNGKLRTLIVSHNTNLNRLPVDELLEIESLTSIECRGCSRLYCPPPEIAELEGVEVVNYLQSARLEHGGILNTDFEMITIGNGEAGKTSVIRAMMNENGTSEKIHEDKRTVGIDLKTWDLTKQEGLVFHIKDLAGQAVYTLTNQYFLVRRAIYLLVWRVDKGKSSSHDTELWEKQISDMVLTWMESLQLRVPGASILLVVTHIDCVPQEELDRQINFVQELVLRKLQDLGDDDDDSSVVPLTIWNKGLSMPVNCLLGQGVPELRQKVQCTVKFLKSSFMLLVYLSF
jgi:GTPase SAR1 family protein